MVVLPFTVQKNPKWKYLRRGFQREWIISKKYGFSSIMENTATNWAFKVDTKAPKISNL